MSLSKVKFVHVSFLRIVAGNFSHVFNISVYINIAQLQMSITRAQNAYNNTASSQSQFYCVFLNLDNFIYVYSGACAASGNAGLRCTPRLSHFTQESLEVRSER